MSKVPVALETSKEKTNFEKVVDFNTQFGLPHYDSVYPSVFTDKPKLVDLRMNLIREEVKELEDAVKNHDYTETVDALADILYVVYGMGSSIGIDLDEAFDIVHKSNMSKLCTSPEEAEKTVEWYKNEYIAKRQPYDSPAFRQSECGTYYVVFNQSTGKILKSINYTPADFTSLTK